ncbi:MAG: response regulator transcription factor [Candidatus Saccharimonas sp.]
MRLLIVEDEQRIASGIKRALELHQFAVDIVDNADDGLASGVDSDYDLIILDRMLPGSMQGNEVCKSIREAGVQTPILMLTALGEIDDKISGLQSGADDYLVKPFSMRELIVRVQVLLRRPPLLLGQVINVADLAIDTEAYSVKRSGYLIELSPREFKLLDYLAHNLGQTLSKDKIISHVWDGDALIMRNTVEVYVGYLRKKIDKAYPSKPKLIQTVHGFGYRLGDRL